MAHESIIEVESLTKVYHMGGVDVPADGPRMFPTQAWKVRCHDDNGLDLVVSHDEGSSPGIFEQ